jgi:ssDNA-binding replication factor A large subunit
MLKLKDAEAGKNISDLVVRVVSVAPARMIATRGGRKTQLTEVLVADQTGTAIFSLWGFGEAASLSAGKVIRITDGWAKEWQGKVQLSLGRSGRFEEVSDDGSLPSISELKAERA